MTTPPASPALAAPPMPFTGLPTTLAWQGGEDGLLRILDQTRLPLETVYRDCTTVEDVWEAIRTLRVRGAPAIGVAAAYGLCLGLRPHRSAAAEIFHARLDEVGRYLCACRPTAVNLAWAVRRATDAARAAGPDSPTAWRALLETAHALARADAAACHRIGVHGAPLVPEGGGVLTHCNAGALATVAWGTALAPLYVAHAAGRRFRVFADETRPLLQGARLTAWELHAAGLDVTVLCDGAAAALMRQGAVQLVLVGADRIAANGDTANKIGTYAVALAARAHGVPLYVAAPTSTFDLSLPDGRAIPIEERPADEIRRGLGREVVPPGVLCWNPAFDVTPAELITGLITERGIIRPVTAETVRAVASAT